MVHVSVSEHRVLRGVKNSKVYAEYLLTSSFGELPQGGARITKCWVRWSLFKAVWVELEKSHATVLREVTHKHKLAAKEVNGWSFSALDPSFLSGRAAALEELCNAFIEAHAASSGGSGSLPEFFTSFLEDGHLGIVKAPSAGDEHAPVPASQPSEAEDALATQQRPVDFASAVHKFLTRHGLSLPTANAGGPALIALGALGLLLSALALVASFAPANRSASTGVVTRTNNVEDSVGSAEAGYVQPWAPASLTASLLAVAAARADALAMTAGATARAMASDAARAAASATVRVKAAAKAAGAKTGAVVAKGAEQSAQYAKTAAAAGVQASKEAWAKGTEAAAQSAEATGRAAKVAAVKTGQAAKVAAVKSGQAAKVAAVKTSEAAKVAAVKGGEAAKVAAVKSGAAAAKGAIVTKHAAIKGGQAAAEGGKLVARNAAKGGQAVAKTSQLASHAMSARSKAAAGLAGKAAAAMESAWIEELRKQCPCPGCPCD